MTTIKFQVPHFDKRIMEKFKQVKQEIIELTGCSDDADLYGICKSEIDKAIIFYNNRLTKEDIENGNFPDEHYAQLFVSMNFLWEFYIYKLKTFLKIFPHRREHMSIKYIAKRMNLPIDILEVWLKLESIESIKKEHGKYYDASDIYNFMEKISYRKYELRITVE